MVTAACIPEVWAWRVFCDVAGHRSMGTIKRAILVNAGVSLLPEPTVCRELDSGERVAVRVEGLRVDATAGHHLSGGAGWAGTARTVGAVSDGGREPIGAGIVPSTDGDGTLRAGRRMCRGNRGNQGVSRGSRAMRWGYLRGRSGR